MTTVSRIIVAIFVLVLAWLFCSLPFLGQEGVMGTLGLFIGFVIAAAIAVGSFFGLGWLEQWTTQRQEKQGNTILGPHVPAGESLKAFTYGYVGPGRTGAILLFGALGDAVINSWRRKFYYVGVTERYAILVQVKNNKPTGVQQVLGRSDVRQLEYSQKAFSGPLLTVQLPADTLELHIEGMGWLPRAKTLPAVWNGLPLTK